MPALEALGAVVSVVFVNDVLKLITRQKTQEVGKHVSFSWHGSPPEELTVGKRLTLLEGSRVGLLSR